MTAAVFNLQVGFTDAGVCLTCGVPIALPVTIKEEALRRRGPTGRSFYCCNGHSQFYVGETAEQKLQRELDAAKKAHAVELEWQRSRREAAERSAAAFKGKVTALKNRVGNGVCPCCKRTFKQLAAHMACKHPEFKSEEA